MTILTLTAAQSAFLTALEQPFLDAFGDGIVLPGGTPATLPGFKGFKDYSSETKLNALNGIKSSFAPLVSLLVKGPETYITVTNFLNGFGPWGDLNYGNGVLRYAKDADGFVRIHGLFGTPTSGVVVNVPAFELPVGYRPAPGDSHIFAAVANSQFCGVEVASSGSVLLKSSPANNTWVSLECRFLAGG